MLDVGRISLKDAVLGSRAEARWNLLKGWEDTGFQLRWIGGKHVHAVLIKIQLCWGQDQPIFARKGSLPCVPSLLLGKNNDIHPCAASVTNPYCYLSSRLDLVDISHSCLTRDARMWALDQHTVFVFQGKLCGDPRPGK